MAWTRDLTAVTSITVINGQFSVTGTVEIKDTGVLKRTSTLTVSGDVEADGTIKGFIKDRFKEAMDQELANAKATDQLTTKLSGIATEI